jgi:8-oxo-dGTP pyrophosphatase MutT (NUDIX family)
MSPRSLLHVPRRASIVDARAARGWARRSVTAVLRPASTVVLLRQEVSGLEVFLVRRHQALAFMGGAHVFPGGSVEESDSDSAWLGIVDGFASAHDRMIGNTRDTLGFHVAAARETFEEAGVLLARRDGQWIPFAQSAETQIGAWRQAIGGGTLRLVDLLQSQRWRLAIDALVYFAHWVTPGVEVKRFDTRFFLAALPPGQNSSHDAGETTAGVWLRPAQALASARSGAIALPPPTWTTLRWLEPFQDVDAALEWGRHKAVPRVEPDFIQHQNTRIVLLPGDEAMPALPGFEASETRFLLEDGRWTPISR